MRRRHIAHIWGVQKSVPRELEDHEVGKRDINYLVTLLQTQMEQHFDTRTALE